MDILCPEDFQILDKYARRVKHLRLEISPPTGGKPDIPSYMYLMILQYHPSPLFPRLEKLSIIDSNGQRHSRHESALLALSPSLQCVSLEDIHQSAEVFTAILLYNISIEAPRLPVLRLSGLLQDKILDEVYSFQFLETLHLGLARSLLRVNTLDAISQMTKLKYLSIKFDNHPPLSSTWTRAFLFNALQVLTLDGALEEITRTLRAIDTPHLHTISLKFHSPEPSKKTAPLLDCIRRCGLTSPFLHTVKLWFARTYKQLPWNILSPLSTRTGLRRLDFHCGSMSLFEGNLMAACVDGQWRSLESLTIQPTDRRQGDMVLPTTALSAISEWCPRLKFLHTSVVIPHSLQAIDDLEFELTHRPHPFHGLEELRIDAISRTPTDAEIVDAAFQTYVEMLYPNLRTTKISFLKGWTMESEIDSIADDLQIFRIFSEPVEVPTSTSPTDSNQEVVDNLESN